MDLFEVLELPGTRADLLAGAAAGGAATKAANMLKAIPTLARAQQQCQGGAAAAGAAAKKAKTRAAALVWLQRYSAHMVQRRSQS